MSELDDIVARLKRRYEGCFGCGIDNPIGLQLTEFELIDDDVVRATWTPRQDYQGFGGMLHGGVVTTALDEVMAWAAMLTEGVAVVTGTLDLRFRNPAPVATSYLVEGRVRERRGRRVLMEGRLEDTAAGHDVASAAAMFLVHETLVLD